MKLLFIIPEIATAGGAEKIVTTLSSYLAEVYNHEVTILNCLPYHQQSFYQIANVVKVDSLNCSTYPTSIIGRLNWYRRLVNPLNEYIQKHDFDIVFAESSYVAASLSLCKTSKSIKVGCDHVSYHSVNFIHKLFRKFLFKRLSAIVVLTEADQQLYLKHHPAVYCIPNFITHLPISSSTQNSKSIVAIGRLEQQKGFDLLIEAMALVHSQHPDWKLIVYGDGSQKAALIANAKSKKLDEVVYFAGEVQDIQTKLCQSSIFVLSSRYEGFPLSLIEAMSCGLCCVSFDIPGAAAVIDHQKNGLLVPKEDVKVLAKTIVQLIEDKKLRTNLGSRAIATSKQYQINVIAQYWLSLLQNLSAHQLSAKKFN